MPTVTATFALELALSSGVWTDVAADVRIGVDPVVAEYGIRGVGPLNRTADTGTLTFSLDNSSSNSGGLQGYYSPKHANARAGFELGIGVRLKITYSGTTYYKFRGSLISVQPDSGIKQRQAVQCVAVDWMDEAARTRIRDVATQVSKRSDQIITTLLNNSVRKQPVARSINTGQSTFAFALDNMQDDRTTLLQALADCVLSEFGYLYTKGDTTQGGTLKFEDRHARPKFGAAAATFDNTMYELDVARSRDDIINHVLVVTHPRKVDAAATTVLYELTTTETTPAIAPMQAITFQVLFRDATGRFVRVGGDAVVTPVAGTDYIGNSASDGSGTVLTSDLSLSFSFTSNSASLAFTNNNIGSTIYLTTLQVRGKAVQDTYQVIMPAADVTSQTTYGETDQTIDLPYEDDLSRAKGIADWVLDTYKDPRYTIRAISIHGNRSATLMTQALAREPGDKIALKETVTGLTNADALSVEIGYFINGVRLTVSAGGIVDVTWPLAPADQQAAWILDQVGASEIGATTVLGFV